MEQKKDAATLVACAYCMVSCTRAKPTGQARFHRLLPRCAAGEQYPHLAAAGTARVIAPRSTIGGGAVCGRARCRIKSASNVEHGMPVEASSSEMVMGRALGLPSGPDS